MKKLMLLMMVTLLAISANAEVIITGILDGPLTGGLPKVIELYIGGTEDLSTYTLERSVNGGDWITLSDVLSGTYTNEFAYLVGTSTNGSGGVVEYEAIFGTSGDFANVALTSNNISGNGNDGFRIKKNGIVVDQVYTNSATNVYLDSYMYRVDETGPDGAVWIESNWIIPGNDILDGLGATQVQTTVPFGTYYMDPNNITDPNTVDPNVPMVDYTYDWEDGYGHVLSTSGNLFKPQNTTEQVYAGSRALKVTQKPVSSSVITKAYLGWVKNLQPGDEVSVKLMAFDDGSIDYHYSRIAADYTASDDITDIIAQVSGTGASTADAGWEQITATFYCETGIEGDPDAMAIAVMLSANWDNTSEDYYFDNIEISVPEHAVVVLPPAYNINDYATYTYGWENFDVTDPDLRETVLLGTMYSIQTGLEYDPTNITTYTGTNAMWIADDDSSSTGQGYMAWIKGLQQGDYIDASCFGRSFPGDDGGSVRMWAHYTYDNEDIRSYAGSAGGYTQYSDPNEWTEFQKLYVFSADPYTVDGVEQTPNGLIIEVRPYSSQGQGGYIDDLTLIVPNHAEVVLPGPDGDAICVGGLPAWDFNADCVFNMLDLVLVMDDWLGCNLQPAEDCGL